VTSGHLPGTARVARRTARSTSHHMASAHWSAVRQAGDSASRLMTHKTTTMKWSVGRCFVCLLCLVSLTCSSSGDNVDSTDGQQIHSS